MYTYREKKSTLHLSLRFILKTRQTSRVQMETGASTLIIEYTLYVPVRMCVHACGIA